MPQFTASTSSRAPRERRSSLPAIAEIHDPDCSNVQRVSAPIATIPHVLQPPSPSAEIIHCNGMGMAIGARPFCHDSGYWQVHHGTDKAIVDVCGAVGRGVPETPRRAASDRRVGPASGTSPWPRSRRLPWRAPAATPSGHSLSPASRISSRSASQTSDFLAP